MKPRPDESPEEYAARVALSLLKVRGWSRAELTARLIARGCDASAASAAVDRLERLGLTGDAAYAREVVSAELRRQPAAAAFLTEKLERRGIGEERAAGEVARQTAGASEAARAEELARSAWRPGGDDLKERRRLAGVLARRGFDEETAAWAIERVMGPMPEGDGSAGGPGDGEHGR
ncbi:MAG: regulatory protein RecX [Phycisphaeraceae bacterium]|nr:MAG: regulatory protein RecX [Phycisphaeraceae bacterium]